MLRFSRLARAVFHELPKAAVPLNWDVSEPILDTRVGKGNSRPHASQIARLVHHSSLKLPIVLRPDVSATALSSGVEDKGTPSFFEDINFLSLRCQTWVTQTQRTFAASSGTLGEGEGYSEKGTCRGTTVPEARRQVKACK